MVLLFIFGLGSVIGAGLATRPRYPGTRLEISAEWGSPQTFSGSLPEDMITFPLTRTSFCKPLRLSGDTMWSREGYARVSSTSWQYWQIGVGTHANSILINPRGLPSLTGAGVPLMCGAGSATSDSGAAGGPLLTAAHQPRQARQVRRLCKTSSAGSGASEPWPELHVLRKNDSHQWKDGRV
jgi:hypothetical protein